MKRWGYLAVTPPLDPFSADAVAAILSRLIHHRGHTKILDPSVSAQVRAALTSRFSYVQRLGAHRGLLHSTGSKSAGTRGPLTMGLHNQDLDLWLEHNTGTETSCALTP